MKAIQLGVHWFSEYAGGGLDRFYWQLVAHLPAVGVEPRGLVAGSAQVEIDSDGRVRAFAPRTARLPERLRSARKAATQLIDEFQPNLVASHFALYTLPVLDRLGGRPLVVHFHGPWADESRMEGQAWPVRWCKGLIERAVYRRGCRFVVLSRAFARVLRERYGVAEDIIRVVPGGVEAWRFAPTGPRAAARARLGWPQDRPLVLAVRRLIRRMGLEDLIDATAALTKQYPDLLIVIAGRGPLEPELRKRVQERGVARHVHFAGFVPDKDLPSAYRAADISVVPSVALEGFGLVAIESLASGTPALVTPIGGLPEVVQALCPDLVLPDSGARALVDGIAAAINRTLRLPNDATCAAFARDHFDWPMIALRIRSVYAEALA